ncbi:MAG: hypothetical protein ACK5QT_06285 [Oligoflexia bacterium]
MMHTDDQPIQKRGFLKTLGSGRGVVLALLWGGALMAALTTPSAQEALAQTNPPVSAPAGTEAGDIPLNQALPNPHQQNLMNEASPNTSAQIKKDKKRKKRASRLKRRIKKKENQLRRAKRRAQKQLQQDR